MTDKSAGNSVFGSSLRRLGRSRVLPAFRAMSALWISMMLAAGLAFMTQVLLARGLGRADYGALAVALAAVSLIAPLAGFGIGPYWLRVYGLEGWKARRWVGPSLRFLAFSAVAACGLLLTWAQWGGLDASIRLLMWLLAPLLIAQALSELVHARFQMEERFGTLALWQTVPHAGRFAVALVAVLAGMGVAHVSAGYMVVALLTSTTAAMLLRPMVRGRFRLVGHGERPQVDVVSPLPRVTAVPQGAWPFALASIFYLIYFQSDIILLAWFIGPEAAGVYNVAVAIMMVAYLLPGVIYQKYLMPKLHRWAEHDRPRFLQVYRLGNSGMLLLGLTVMAGLLLAGPWGVRWAFGPKYAEAEGVILLLAFCVPVRFWAASPGGVMSTADRIYQKVVFQGCAAFANILGNLFLIPPYGVYGAAISTFISEVILLILLLRAAQRVALASSTQAPKA